MSLRHFKYVGKREIVAANAATSGAKARTVKAMTLPARMAPPDFSSSESPAATGTLQPQNSNTARESLVDDETGKFHQALLEANMATEIGLITLDCIGLFCIHFKVSLLQQRMNRKIIIIMIKRRQNVYESGCLSGCTPRRRR